MRRAPRWRGWLVVVAVAAVAGGVAGALAGGLDEDDAGTAGGACAPTDGPVTSVPSLAGAVAVVRGSIVSVSSAWTVFDEAGSPILGRMEGSGFVLAGGGVIATSAHLVDQGGTVTVTLPSGEEVEGRLLGIDEEHDLALVDAAGGAADLEPALIGCSADLRVGDPVFAIGDALGLDGDPTVSAGVLSAIDRQLTTESGRHYHELLQVDVAISAGQSGGPVVNGAGEVVGITVAAQTGTSGVGFAVGIDDAVPVLEGLRASSR